MLGRKSFLVAINHFIQYLTGWLGLFFIARFMVSPEYNYGMVQFALGTVSLFGFIGGFFGGAHVKRLSGGEIEDDRCMGTYISLKTLATFVTVVVIFGGLLFWKYLLGRGFESPTHETVIYIILGFFILRSIGNIGTKTFEAKIQIAKRETIRFMDHSIPTIFIIYVALTGGQALELALTYVTGGALAALLTIFYLKDIQVKKPDRGSIKSYWDFGLPSFFSGIVAKFGNRVDVLMVQLFWGSSNVGFYAAGRQLALIVNGLVGGIGTVIFPTISEYHAKKDWESLKRSVEGAARYTSLFITPIIAFLIIFPRRIIYIMISGNFLQAAPIVRILAINSFFVLYFRPFQQVIPGMDRPKLSAKISIAGNVANVALNILLIPDSLFGIPLFGLKEVGAAMATLTAGISIALAKYVVSKRLADVSFSWSTLYHIAAAALSGTILFISENQFLPIDRFYHLLFYGAAMLAIYTAILYLVGEFTKKEWNYIMDAINPMEMWTYVKDELTGKDEKT
ncbi:MAG: oligosaccharide flippase family protein [Candidatus Aenigmatarchaeota archaeon]